MVSGYYWPSRYLRHCSYLILFMNPGINFTNCKKYIIIRQNIEIWIESQIKLINKRTHLFDVLHTIRGTMAKVTNWAITTLADNNLLPLQNKSYVEIMRRCNFKNDHLIDPRLSLKPLYLVMFTTHQLNLLML